MIAVQQQQGIFADGYTTMPLRTGYEQIIAQRTTSAFATAAAEDGEVIDVNKRSIVVRYASGKIERAPLGALHRSAAGIIYPHELVTDLTKGDKVKRGDILSYNRKFFMPDTFNRNQVTWKAGVLCRTAILDNIDTLEDGSVISEETARKLNSQSTELRTITVRFDQSVHQLVKVGDRVDLETILCTIEDPELTDNPLFDSVALDTLRRLSTMAPKAKAVGTVAKIECFYHGDFEDLSPNLQELARESDKERARQARALGEPVLTGQVDASFRIRGQALEPDTMAIQIYIDREVPAGVGD